MLERREKLRARVALPGQAAFAAVASAVPCTVLDFSMVGACIEFEQGVAVPRLFELRIGLDPKPCAVRVVWRTLGRVGVAFLKARAAPDIFPG